MAKAISTVFDYERVGKDTKGKLIRLAGQAKQEHFKFKKSGLEIGQIMAEAFDLFAGQTKLFELWIETETDLGTSTAYNCRNVWIAAQDCPILGELPTTVSYILSPASVPKAAVKEIEKLVNNGEQVTVAMAKAAVKKHSPPRVKAVSEATKEPEPPVHEPALEILDQSVVGKKFTELLSLIGKMIRLCDEVKPHVPAQEYQAIYDSLDIASRELTKWRDKWKKMKVVS